MSDNLNWETIDVPQGSYIGWGDRPGQHATGVVLAYAPQGGKDFDDQPCPLLTLELLEEAYSHSKKQGWQKIASGDLVQLNCGQTSLKKAVMASGAAPGDLVKISLDEILHGQGKNNGDVKVFGIKIVRGYRKGAAPAAAPAFAQQAPAQPAFAAPAPAQQQPAFATPGPGQQGGPPAFADDAPPF